MQKYKISEDGRYVLRDGTACAFCRQMPEHIAALKPESELSDSDAQLVEQTISNLNQIARNSINPSRTKLI